MNTPDYYQLIVKCELRRIKRKEFYLEIRKVCDGLKAVLAEIYFEEIPEKYHKEFIKMLAAGLRDKESFDLLQDTYKF